MVYVKYKHINLNQSLISGFSEGVHYSDEIRLQPITMPSNRTYGVHLFRPLTTRADPHVSKLTLIMLSTPFCQ